MYIRPATKDDMANIELLFRLPELVIATGEYLSEDILINYLDDKFFLVAEENGSIIAAILANDCVLKVSCSGILRSKNRFKELVLGVNYSHNLKKI